MKVLIADDNHISRITLSAYVKKLGYPTIVAENGLEAIDVWEKEQPALVLTDWNMPQCSGLELIQHIRKNEGSLYTYTILITAREAQQDMIQGFEAGVDDYLTKPVNTHELALRIKAGERVLSLQSKDTLIFALATLAETRDHETGEHLDRMRIYSAEIARELMRRGTFNGEINERFIRTIYDTSPLHDVGKVGIPDHILLKPGRLTLDEFEIMKTHTVIGERALLNVYKQSHAVRYLEMAVDIAGGHHEKWDGTGYPKGLKGEDIPLSARIVALADVYDALRSKRVYKESFRHEKSKAIILEGVDTHFDRRVVDAFLALEDRLLEFSASYETELS